MAPLFISKAQSIGRRFFGVALVAFALQHFFYRRAVSRIVPDLPQILPAHTLWAWLSGAGLVLSGVWLFTGGKHTRSVAIYSGVALLALAVILYSPQLALAPAWSVVWTQTGKALAFAGAAFLIAESLPIEHGALTGSLEHFVPAGRALLAAFLILCGIQHFLFLPFVATLVPAWIPGHIFWTAFAGVALITGGVGMLIPLTERLAGALSALMIFLWVLLLHIPRALATPHDPGETTSLFEALAISGAALLVAANAVVRHASRAAQKLSSTMPREASL